MFHIENPFSRHEVSYEPAFHHGKDASHKRHKVLFRDVYHLHSTILVFTVFYNNANVNLSNKIKKTRLKPRPGFSSSVEGVSEPGSSTLLPNFISSRFSRLNKFSTMRFRFFVAFPCDKTKFESVLWSNQSFCTS